MSGRFIGWLFVAAYAYGGALIIVHAPAYAIGGGIMMYAAGLIGGILIAHPAKGRAP